ncbi:hypothetical protein BH10PSE14_BH10PSE14_27420 [soil metagenome]
MTGTVIISLKDVIEIERLEHLGPTEKLRYWAGGKPWDGFRLPNETKIKRVSLNGCDIGSMPQLGGKPCFGVPTAWLRFSDDRLKWVGTKWVPKRCGACLARTGCQKVSEVRLRCNDEVSQAVSDFFAAGGPSELRSPRYPSSVGARFRDVTDALIRAGSFKNSNDPFAKEWARTEIDRLRGRDRVKKQEQRAKQARQRLREGEISSELIELLGRERQFRKISYRQYLDAIAIPGSKLPMIPQSIARGDPKFTADVWHAATTLRLMKQSSTPYAIASYMITQEIAENHNRESLRDRVRSAVDRIALLESKLMIGSAMPIWPRFIGKEAMKELFDDP